MDYMTVQDIRKLAIKVRLEKSRSNEWDHWQYAKVNAWLNRRFNVGRDQFKARLNQLISRAPVIRCPWAHVGKNH